MNDDRIAGNSAAVSNQSGGLAKESRQRFRLAALFHRPHPYFCKFFQRLAAHPEIDLTVYFYSDLGIRATPDPGYRRSVQWDTDLLAGYRHRFLRNYSPWPALHRYTGLFHPALLREVDRRYDAVLVHGWWGLSTSLAMVTALARRVPILLHSDKNVIEAGKKWRRRFRNLVLQALFRRVAAFLVIGQRNAAFYRSLGVPEERMFLAPLAVDNAFFRAEAQRLKSERYTLRHQYGIPPEATVILYVGRLAPEKGLLDLLAAFAGLSDGSAHLALVGDGPQRAALEDYVRSYHLRCVHFAGFQNYSQLPSFYALSDVFVLPSYREPWGAVVNEAMNFALPVVASQDGGAVADLVENGRNGLLFEPGDQGQLARHLQYLVSHPEVREQMGAESARRIAVWDFERGIEGVLAALHAVAHCAQREAG